MPEAITKATASAKKTMVRVPLKEGRTLHHDGKGRFGAGKVTIRSAPPGTGIIAGGPMRAVFESLGVADVVTKSVGTSNPYNMIRATFDALQQRLHAEQHVPCTRSALHSGNGTIKAHGVRTVDALRGADLKEPEDESGRRRSSARIR